MEDNLDKFEENTALFDAYLRGEMPPEKRAEFEARLATDASFQSDFDLHRALLGSMKRNWERERLRGQVKEAREAMLHQGKSTGGGQRRNRFLMPIAACFLLLVVAGSVWYFWPGTQPPDEEENEQSDDSRPQALNEQTGDNETLSGAKKESVYEITAQSVKMTGGKRHKSTGTRYTVQLLETPEDKVVVVVEDSEIRLFFPAGQAPKDQLTLIELDLNGKTRLFLQNGTQYFELRNTKEKQYLTQVTDPAILSLLK